MILTIGLAITFLYQPEMILVEENQYALCGAKSEGLKIRLNRLLRSKEAQENA
jgi:hypothetical protein